MVYQHKILRYDMFLTDSETMAQDLDEFSSQGWELFSTCYGKAEQASTLVFVLRRKATLANLE